MAVVLPSLTPEDFGGRLQAELGAPVLPGVLEALWVHYQHLGLWARRASLVGPAAAAEIVERHYAESLAGLPLMGAAERALDLGSGAGFPGFVLAAASPNTKFTLVEAREKKVAFLRSVTDRAGLSCGIVGARVSRRRPPPVDRIQLVTVRAVRLDDRTLEGLAECLERPARLLRWEGPSALDVPAGAKRGRTVELNGSRRIQEWLWE